MTAEQLADMVEDPREFSQIVDGVTSAQLQDAVKVLLGRGWKKTQSLSECSVADYQVSLRRGQRRAEVLSSYFRGPFAEIVSYVGD